jgi:hypothetical protein
VASSDLTPAIQELEPTAADARALFGTLKPFLGTVQPLLVQLPPAAVKLRTVVLPLDALLRQSNPAIAYLRNYATEFGSFFANVGAFLSPDALGFRGRVFPMGGPNMFTDLTPT